MIDTGCQFFPRWSTESIQSNTKPLRAFLNPDKLILKVYFSPFRIISWRKGVGCDLLALKHTVKLQLSRQCGIDRRLNTRINGSQSEYHLQVLKAIKDNDNSLYWQLLQGRFLLGTGILLARLWLLGETLSLLVVMWLTLLISTCVIHKWIFMK